MVGVGLGNGKKFCYTFFLSRLERFFRTDINARARRGYDKYGFCRSNGFSYSALEVKKTGCVDYVKFCVVPFNSRHCGGNR